MGLILISINLNINMTVNNGTASLTYKIMYSIEKKNLDSLISPIT